MNSQAVKAEEILRWHELSAEAREILRSRLAGLWSAPDDQGAFDQLSLDKQQALLILAGRLSQIGLWQAVRRIKNVYGIGGVGIDFEAWPFLESELRRRPDFTRRFAKRKSVSGGFYERGRSRAALHFLFQNTEPRLWHVHFDFYNPVHSVPAFMQHVRHEYFGKLRPDWQMIGRYFKAS